MNENHPTIKLLSVLFYVYLFSCSFAAVYFNWQFARQNGFISWVFFGEVISTGKGFIWPYFAFSNHSNSSAKGTGAHPNVTENPDNPYRDKSLADELNDSEMAQFSAVFKSALDEGMTPALSNQIQAILSAHQARTGTRLSRKWYDSEFGDFLTLAQYKLELGRSALLSWDSDRYTVTPEFPDLRSKAAHLMTGAESTNDTQMIEAAGRHDPTITEDGRTFEFDRSSVLRGVGKRERQMGDVKEMLAIVNQYVD